MSKKQTISEKLAAAEARIRDLEAGDVQRIGRAFDALDALLVAGPLRGGRLTMHITAPDGREVVRPVMLHAGLSDRTIVALQDDLRRAFDVVAAVNPATAWPDVPETGSKEPISLVQDRTGKELK